MIRRPIAYDVTHLVSRLPTHQSSGIDKVDLAFAKFFAGAGCDALIHYGTRRPRVHAPEALTALLRHTAVASPLSGYDHVYRWLTGNTPAAEPATGSPVGDNRPSRIWPRRLAHLGWRMAPGVGSVPKDALYLNVAQHAFEKHRFFRWLPGRPDVLAVFLIHDLLPLDWPEYFRPGYRQRFMRRWQTALRHGRALVTTTEAVKERILAELAASGHTPRPIHVEPLPSPLAGQTGVDDARLQAAPYFVIVGTIEPRKNHLLLLNVWRRMAQEMAAPPKLVIVGTRGWENEQVLDVLDRSELVRPHVLEVSNLGETALARLIKNARGLLMPSFAEGYGLPIVEALSLGTPVVASDIPVFREVAQGHAVFRHPLDGLGWREAILALADAPPPASRAASGFVAPTWDAYFARLMAFLDTLP